MKNLIMILIVIPFYYSTAQIYSRVTDATNPIVSTQMTANYSGSAWIDYNNDGLIDLFSSQSFLFKNLGDGNFELVETVIGADIGGQSNGITWSDYDNDGDIDLFMAGRQSSLYENMGNNTFQKIITGELNVEKDLRGWAASWGDFDKDGFTDLVVTHPAGFLGPSPTSNHLFYNNGGLLIRSNDTPVTSDIAPFTIPSFTDYDLDGDLDLFIGSGPAGTAAKDYIYSNQISQTGVFEYIRITDEEFATDLQDGQVWNFVDYDNDGDLDAFVTNYGGTDNNFYQNNNGVFTNISNELTISGAKLANTWGDVDNDGDLDLIVTGDSDNDFYLNNGDGSFTSIQNEIADLTSVSATLGDYDDDGDLDLFLSGGETALFKNVIDNNHNWILINLEGTVSNRSALGAKVKVKSKIDGIDVWQMREVSAQNSFNGHNSLRVHFGLNNSQQIDSLIVIWPNSPAQAFENIEVNQILNLIEPLPNDFIRVNFKADIIFGLGLSDIQFTDLSIADPNNPIVSWEWDFNSDGITDATEQNPIWRYDSLGVYSVKLKISNSIENIERVKENYITLIRKPGIPVISSLSHTFADTTVQKGDQIEFSVSALDTTGYEISYEWFLNSVSKGRGPKYRYGARTQPYIPRTDTLVLSVSNGFNFSNNKWLINVDDVTSVNEASKFPNVFALRQNYPNPFNPSTFINYELPKRGEVSLKVYDLLGKEVISLVNKEQEPGFYNIEFNAGQLASGVYIYKLRAENFVESKKMILLR